MPGTACRIEHDTCVVLLMTCPADVLLDTRVPLLGFPKMVWFVETIVTVAPVGPDGAGASELSSCDLTCSIDKRVTSFVASTVTVRVGR